MAHVPSAHPLPICDAILAYNRYRALWSTLSLAPERDSDKFISDYTPRRALAQLDLSWLDLINRRPLPDPVALSSYGDYRGPESLRRVISTLDHQLWDTTYAFDNILVTPSATAGIAAILLATKLCFSDGVVAIECPTYYLCESLSRALGLRTILFDKTTTSDDLQAALSDQVRLIFLTEPSFPDGVCRSPDRLACLQQIARKIGALLVIDEAFAYSIHLQGTPLALSREEVVRVRSFSKIWGFSSFRGGCIIGDESFLRRVGEASELLFCRGDWKSYTLVEDLLLLQGGAYCPCDAPLDVVSRYQRTHRMLLDSMTSGLSHLKAAAAAVGMQCSATVAGFSATVDLGENVDLDEDWEVLVEHVARTTGYMVHLDNMLSRAAMRSNSAARFSLDFPQSAYHSVLLSIRSFLGR